MSDSTSSPRSSALAAQAHRLARQRPASELGPEQVSATVAGIVTRLAPLLDRRARDQLVMTVIDRLQGLGPLDELLRGDGVTDVLINGPGPILVERHGRLEVTDHRVDSADIDHLVERMVAPLGRRLDRTSPLVDGRLADGSRVHVAAAPVAVDGPYVTIRRFQVRELELSEVAGPGVASLLRWAVTARANVLVSGGTGSGKTTLLNALAGDIGPTERIVTIEDAAELRFGSGHVVRLETRPAMVDGPPAIGIRELVRNALRMRPDRIVVGEVRGAETIDMLQAMNTGHEGSLTTVHANSAADALRRLEAMVLMDSPMPQAMARDQIQQAVDLVVHLVRLGNGHRRVAAVAEPVVGDRLDVRLLTDHRGHLCRLPSRPPRSSGPSPSDAWLDQQ